ncbi:D-amino-acid transaminase [Bacillaceae bacterium IKA-2]|nr:D-amino-acid transaminase [Bacillaceae bacterium IKA-2]
MTYVLFNNQITMRENVKIDIEDRGYNFGDGIYEVIPVYNSKPFASEEHLQRFESSAEKLEIKLPYKKELLQSLLTDLIYKNNLVTGILYIQMTRGVFTRAHLYERNVPGLITGLTQKIDFPFEQKQTGIAVFVTEDIRWLRCDIKTINLLGNTMLKRQAADNQCHEAIMYRTTLLTEGSSSNLFIVKDGTLITHPATNLILNGITRQIILKLARQANIPIKEQAFTLEQLKEADEVFLTSTTQEVTPIVSTKGDLKTTFSIGTVTRTLQKLFIDYRETSSGE